MPDDSLRGPALESAVSNALIRILREFYGKGPSRARTYIFDNYVFSMLDEPFTTIERTLIDDGGDQDLVRQVRVTFEDLMTKTFVGEIEKLTGRSVVGYHSQVVFNPDMTMEMFILEAESRPSQGMSEAEADITHAALDEPGEVGDVDRLPSADGPALANPDVTLEALGARPQEDGRVRTAISNAMVRITHEQYGRGPQRSKTFMADNYAFCVLEDLLTTVERTLLEGGQAPLVRHMRTRFHDLKARVFAAEVEKLTGRRVIASHSQIVFDPDVVFQLFVFDRTPR